MVLPGPARPDASGPRVLIAGLSGRSLAQAARRSGYVPLVADLFSDCDTRDAAEQCVRLDADLSTGITGPALTAGLRCLVEHSTAVPVALVCGSGFEDRPALAQAAANAVGIPLAGTRPSEIEALKRPDRFFALLARLGIPHPETRADAPPHRRGWLRKRLGGAGGSHVVPAVWASDRPDEAAYYQRRVKGSAVSTLFLASGGDVEIVGFSRQWVAPRRGAPFRFGGLAGPDVVPGALRDSMVGAIRALVGGIDIRGLASADFLAAGDRWWLIEVNPRPGASLDVFDRGDARLFDAHLQASHDHPPRPTGSATRDADRSVGPARALAYLYAPRALTVPDGFAWPDWTADRPHAGDRIRRHWPVCTVLAAGADAAAAQANAVALVGSLTAALYKNNNGRKQSERSERLRASQCQ